MPIKFRCTCGKAYKVDDTHAGHKMVCKGCGKKLKVPGGVEAAVAAGDSFEFSNELPDRTPKGAAPPPLVSGKRKKRKPPEESAAARGPSAGRKTMLIAGLALFGLLGIGGIAYVVTSAGGGGGASGEAAAPQQYLTFASDQGSIKCEYPEGWTPEQGGGTGGVAPWARFKDDTATIEIKGSASGSAISDIAGAGQFPGGMDDMDDELSPIAKVHDFQKSKVASLYSDYEEKPGNNIDIPWGEVRMSEFTASEGLLGGGVQGYRVTLTGVKWQYNLVCKCPSRQWDEYRPTFDHVIHSVGR